MITERCLAAGLHMLGIAYNRPITANTLKLYRAVCGALMDDAAWEAAVQRALETERFWPAPAVLLDGASKVAAVAAEAGAVEVFDKLRRCYKWNPVSGLAIYDRHLLRDRFGEAAETAFMAAGGQGALQTSDPRELGFARRAFVLAYVAAQKGASNGAPQRRLPGNGPSLPQERAAQEAASEGRPGATEAVARQPVAASAARRSA